MVKVKVCPQRVGGSAVSAESCATAWTYGYAKKAGAGSGVPGPERPDRCPRREARPLSSPWPAAAVTLSFSVTGTMLYAHAAGPARHRSLGQAAALSNPNRAHRACWNNGREIFYW